MMTRPCTISLDNIVYYPGQTINGWVECNFSSEEKARGISVRLKGRTKVRWKEGRNSTYSDDVTYFEMESDLLASETTFPPGKYKYPFRFTLPIDIPPSLIQTYGDTKYYAEAKVDRPWAIDYKDKLPFTVHSYIDLNNILALRNPTVMDKIKIPMEYCTSNNGSIKFSVHLPVTGYVPSQMITFTAKVSNMSNINVQAVQFHLVQKFTFYACERTKVVKTVEGQTFEIIDGSVPSGHEKSWNLELRVPQEMYTETLQLCRIIKCTTELKGEVVLPLLHRNLKLAFPITIGSVPLALNE